ncbi:MAG: hypothetical protein ACMXYC_04560 [Candidatus Woesearchaeota archaeon]
MQDIITQVTRSDIYKQWATQDSFLVYVMCTYVNNTYEGWHVGFSKGTDVVDFVVHPQVALQEQGEPMHQQQVYPVCVEDTVPISVIITAVKEFAQTQYSNHPLSRMFCIYHIVDGQPSWDVTAISMTLKTIHFRLDKDATVIKDQVIDLFKFDKGFNSGQ